MKETKHKLLSLAMTFVMVLGMLPAMTLTAEAAEVNITEDTTGGDIFITENTTFNIDENANYTVDSIRFDSDATLTVTGGGGLCVNGAITSYGFDINIIMDSSWIDAQSVAAGDGFAGVGSSVTEANGGDGFNVIITTNGNSQVHVYPNSITGGNGGIGASYEDPDIGTIQSDAGNGGKVEINMNGGFFQAQAISAGADGGGSTLGDVNLTIKAGCFVADSINGSDESTMDIDGGSVEITDMNGIRPTSNGTDVYLTTVTVGTTVLDEEDVTYTVDGGSEISSSTDDDTKLYLWLQTGNHSIEVEYDGITYIGDVTTSADGTAAVTLQKIAVKVTNGSTTAFYPTWAEAVGAVQAGGTITLFEDVTMTSSDVFPSVACTIDGGTDQHKLGLYSGTAYLNADMTFKDLSMASEHDSKSLFVYEITGEVDGHNLTIQGTVTATNVNIFASYISTQLSVEGALTCFKMSTPKKVTVAPSGEINANEMYSMNLENNGIISSGDVDIKETLSGTGTITIKKSTGYLCLPSNSIAADCDMTLKAGYTPASGQILIKNSSTATELLNIDKITLGEGFEQFAIRGAVDGSNYNYILKSKRTFIFNDKEVPYGSGIPICNTTVTPHLEAGETVVYTFYPTENDRTAGTNGITIIPQDVGTYYMRATIAESATCIAASADATLTITKDIGPGAPMEVSMDDDANTFQFTPIFSHTDLSLYEYKIEGDTLWRTVTANPISVGNIAGSVQVRLKESENYEAGSILTSSSSFTAKLEGSVSITGTPEYGKTLTAAVINTQSNAVLSYQWKRGTTDIGTDSTYTLSESDIGKTITVTVTAADYIGSLMSETETITKAVPPNAPSGITADSVSTNSITLTTISGAEYSVDGENWQDSPTFTGLTAATQYKFYARIKETNTQFASGECYTWIYTRAEAPAPSAATVDFINETLSFDFTTYRMNTAEDFTGTAINSGHSISAYTGQTLYIRTNFYGGETASEATAVSIPARPAAPTISHVSKNLVSSPFPNVTATVDVTESGSFVYRVNNGSWQTSNVFSERNLDVDYTFEAAYAATASAFRSEVASQTKKWDITDFTAPEIAPFITSIDPPVKNATSLTLPTLPEGFTVKIKSVSPDTTVLSTNGTITPPKTETTVKVVLTVTKTGDSLTGDTGEISVVIPAKKSSHSGDSSSSGGSTTNKPKTEANATPSSGTNASTVTATAKTGENGIATASVTKEQIASAVVAAVEEGKKTGTDQTAVEIAINAANGAAGVSLTIPEAAFDNIESSSVSVLTISSPVVAVTFDKTALAEIHRSTNADIRIMAKSLDKTTFSDEDKAKIGDRPVYDLTVTSGNTTISSFGGGSATVSIPYTPGVGEDVNKIVIYYISDSGELIMVPDCVYNTESGMVTFATKHFSKYAVGYHNVSFSDISGWSEPYINYLAAREIINGTGEGKFSPNANITRGEFVAILARLSGDQLGGHNSSVFHDVAPSDWYFPSVNWAYKNGITSGYDGEFHPNGIITREQMAVMLYNYSKYAGYEVPSEDNIFIKKFSDYESISPWATSAITWAIEAGIASGNADGSFAPTQSATRAVAAKMIAILQKSSLNNI